MERQLVCPCMGLGQDAPATSARERCPSCTTVSSAETPSYGIVPIVELQDGRTFLLMQTSLSAIKFDLKIDPLRGFQWRTRAARETPWQTATRKALQETFHALSFEREPECLRARQPVFDASQRVFFVRFRMEEADMDGMVAAAQSNMRTVKNDDIQSLCFVPLPKNGSLFELAEGLRFARHAQAILAVAQSIKQYRFASLPTFVLKREENDGIVTYFATQAPPAAAGATATVAPTATVAQDAPAAAVSDAEAEQAPPPPSYESPDPTRPPALETVWRFFTATFRERFSKDRDAYLLDLWVSHLARFPGDRERLHRAINQRHALRLTVQHLAQRPDTEQRLEKVLGQHAVDHLLENMRALRI